jgi:Dolichyl-phosphate-mannose-protein mannosyltransferase
METAPRSQSNASHLSRPPSVNGRPAALSTLAALAAGLTLRLWMLRNFFEINGDSLIYGGLAKNLLLHGRYALNGEGGEMYFTLIRLPGYPLFMALCFRLFGMENYYSVALVQIAMELIGCLLLAGFVRRIAKPGTASGAAQCALWLAALCPFTAVYAAAPLTETPTLFAITLALWSMARFHERRGWWAALLFTFAVTFAALLRPDGALVAIALAPAMLIGLRGMDAAAAEPRQAPLHYVAVMRGRKPAPFLIGRIAPLRAATLPTTDARATTKGPPAFTGITPAQDATNVKVTAAIKGGSTSSGTPKSAGDEAAIKSAARLRLRRIAVTCTLLALTPFAIWTARNWRVFHVIQPLAPRYATDPGETTYPGWQRWVKTWCLDFVSTYEVYWPVPGSPLDLTKLPSRAFDSPAQYAETAALAADLNQETDITPELDARFERLAEERIAAHPLRYYGWLPLGRMADMWLRPRVDNLPIDLDWWVYAHHNAETRFSWFYAALNAFYLLLAIAGLCARPRFWPWMLAYIVLRSALLMTIEAPEARYTLECFPMLFALGGIALYRLLYVVCLLVGKVNASPGKV